MSKVSYLFLAGVFSLVALHPNILFAAVEFTDVADQVGVNPTSVPYGHGAAFADFNNDGLLDLVMSVKLTRNYLFINEGTHFREIAYEAGINSFIRYAYDPDQGRDVVTDGVRGVTVADYDNDGFADIFMAAGGLTSNDHLYRNNGASVGGDPTFEDVTGIARVNNKGNGDIGTWGDYNGDGWVDLYVANWDYSDGYDVHGLYRNNGDGTFTNVVGSDIPAQVQNIPEHSNNVGIFFDYDNDRDLDLFVSRWTEEGEPDYPHRLWRNNGNGTFTDVAASAGLTQQSTRITGQKGQGVVAADFNNDGYFDLYLGSDNAANSLFMNQGNGTFVDIAQSAGVADRGRTVDVGAADFDNDGWMDIFVGNYNSCKGFYFNNGDGTSFTNRPGNAADCGSEARPTATSIGDYNNDGFVDIYYANSFTPKRLYRNEGSGNNWLQVELKGVQDNRMGISARVEVVVNGSRRSQYVAGGRGYESQDSPILTFGLGSATNVSELKVLWPTGREDYFTNVPANQRFKIVQGQGGPKGIPGDVDNNGKVEANDLQMCVNVVLGVSTNKMADTNEDGSINAADIQFIINILLGG